jgi:serine/threonine protein phosphatase 1
MPFTDPGPALYRRVSRNLVGRDFIAGDLHGTLTDFMRALTAAGFDERAGDRLFLVGDLVDRGPESFRMLSLLEQPWVFAVRGNHETMAIDWATGRSDDMGLYIANGGGWFVSLTQPEQCEFADAFLSLPIALELETADGLVGIVHAECPFPEFRQLEAELVGPRAEAVIMACTWSRTRIQCAYEDLVGDVRAVVVGHTPMNNWTSLGNHIFIDTMGWRPGGRFTILDAATLQPVSYSLPVRA